jgi:hypothetical protein
VDAPERDGSPAAATLACRVPAHPLLLYHNDSLLAPIALQRTDLLKDEWLPGSWPAVSTRGRAAGG